MTQSTKPIDQIIDCARQDLPASECARKLRMTYAQLASYVRSHSIFKTYTAIRQNEQRHALSRVFSSVESSPALPPIPAAPRPQAESRPATKGKK